MYSKKYVFYYGRRIPQKQLPVNVPLYVPGPADSGSVLLHVAYKRGPHGRFGSYLARVRLAEEGGGTDSDC